MKNKIILTMIIVLFLVSIATVASTVFIAKTYNVPLTSATLLQTSADKNKTPTKQLQFTKESEIQDNAIIVFFKVGCPYCEEQYEYIIKERNRQIENDPSAEQRIKFLNIESKLGQSFVASHGVRYASTIFNNQTKSINTIVLYNKATDSYTVDTSSLAKLFE